jgi:hypothetical protein
MASTVIKRLFWSGNPLTVLLRPNAGTLAPQEVEVDGYLEIRQKISAEVAQEVQLEQQGWRVSARVLGSMPGNGSTAC